MPLRVKIGYLIGLVLLGTTFYLLWSDNVDLHTEIKQFTDDYGELFDGSEEKRSFFNVLSIIIGVLLCLLFILTILIKPPKSQTDEQTDNFILDENEEETISEVSVEEWATTQQKQWNPSDGFDKILSHFADHTNALAGIIYKVEGKNVVPEASYAFKEATPHFEKGNALPGEAAKSGKTIRVNPVPESYQPEGSGLGNTHPEEVLILPAQTAGTMIAVIELALMAPLSDELQQKCETLAGKAAHHLQNLQTA